MTNFKVALGEEIRGVSVHNDLKSARQSHKKHGAKYRIFKWIGSQGKGYWSEIK